MSNFANMPKSLSKVCEVVDVALGGLKGFNVAELIASYAAVHSPTQVLEDHFEKSDVQPVKRETIHADGEFKHELITNAAETLMRLNRGRFNVIIHIATRVFADAGREIAYCRSNDCKKFTVSVLANFRQVGVIECKSLLEVEQAVTFVMSTGQLDQLIYEGIFARCSYRHLQYDRAGELVRMSKSARDE